MGREGSAIGVRWRPAAAGLSLMAAAGLAVGSCGSSSSGLAAPVCARDDTAAAKAHTAIGPGSVGQPSGSVKAAVAPAWTLPGGNLQNTRDVASAINSSNVSKLGVAWTVPLRIPITHTDGAYATTPVVVNGVVYVQDLESNVMAISLATGKVLWTHTYSSPNGGPDGVTVANGVVYGATNHAAFALSAASGRQLWIRTLIGNDHEGIDMTPGYNHGTVYVSTVPVNPTVGEYLGGAPPVADHRASRGRGPGRPDRPGGRCGRVPPPGARRADVRRLRFTMSPDGRFVAGPVPGMPGLWVASGCNGSGFSSSPAIGEALAAWITTGTAPPGMAGLSPERFGPLPDDEITTAGLWQYAHYYDPLTAETPEAGRG